MHDINRYAALSDEQLHGVHAACESFERALQNGEPIGIEDCLAAVAEEIRGPLFRELLAIELERQLPRDRPPQMDEYRPRFPDRLGDIERVFQEKSRAWSAEDTPNKGSMEPETIGLTAPTTGPASASVPGYEIEGVLGRGGMGVVYKARHLKLKRTVALKMVLAGGHAGPHELARFRIEAEAVARLAHPNIVQIHEVGEADGHPYCALEFVEGGNLAGKLGGARQPAREAAKLVEKLARAMQLAHSRNIVHRDLKPANILLTPGEDGGWGTPKITDFGLAKQLDNDSGATQAGAVMGTPSYMAPEQASGQAHEAGPAADVYALGAILYDALTGRPPFKGASVAETLDLVRTQEPVPPSRWQKSVPLDLDTICLKCLRKEPEKRYSSAAELADELVRQLNGEPILARPVGRIERFGKWVKRNPLPAGAAAAVLLVLMAGIAVSSYFAVEANQQADRAEKKADDADEQKKIADGKAVEANAAAIREADQKRIAQAKEQKANKARDFLVSIFRIAETDIQGGNVTAREILAVAEKRIAVEFDDEPELRGELQKAIRNVKRGIARRTPQAMILVVRGTVQLQSAAGKTKPALPQTLLTLDDRLTLAPDAQVELVFLEDLHKERLKGGRKATIDTKGCQPVDAVLERDASILMTFVRVPKGTFYRGWDGSNAALKYPINEDFEIAVHTVTQGQWQAIMGDNPSHFSRNGRESAGVKDISDEELKLFPVEMVSWDDAQAFIKKLNEKEDGRGYVYRLPKDVEWEYACRGRATSQAECSWFFYFDKPTNDLSSEQANFNGTQPSGKAPKGKNLGRPTRVGAYPSNKLGLCDMHGNVGQWCLDSIDEGKLRMYRGGTWLHDGNSCQAQCRAGDRPLAKWNNRGFRLVRVPVRDAGADPEQALAKRYPALLRGEDKPFDNAERLIFAQIAYDQKHFAFAARLLAEAMASDSKLADDPQAPHRYNAARAAALAAIGQGKDTPPPGDAAKTKLRRQALDWLFADLAVRGNQLGAAFPVYGRPGAVAKLSSWQKDSALAGLRDKDALDKIPADERRLFDHLWAEVAGTLKNAEIWMNTPIGPVHEALQRLVLPGQVDKQNPILVYQVKLTAGTTYVIDMASANQKALDPYLVLTDAAGKLLTHDDDSGGSGNAQIVFRPEQTGTVRIYATSLNTQGVGPFTLTVRE